MLQPSGRLSFWESFFIENLPDGNCGALESAKPIAGTGICQSYCWNWNLPSLLLELKSAKPIAGAEICQAYCWSWNLPSLLLELKSAKPIAGAEICQAYCWNWNLPSLLLELEFALSYQLRWNLPRPIAGTGICQGLKLELRDYKNVCVCLDVWNGIVNNKHAHTKVLHT